MKSREEFLTLLWEEIINPNMSEEWIEKSIKEAKKHPDAPFSDDGTALENLLSLGANKKDICLLSRSAAYDAVFTLLYMLGDPGVEGNDIEMLHETLLESDPSGKEGRPGSAP